MKKNKSLPLVEGTTKSNVKNTTGGTKAVPPPPRKIKTDAEAIDDFWTSVGIMQGRGNASVKTQRIKDLEAGKISVFQATPKGESTFGLVLTGLILSKNKN